MKKIIQVLSICIFSLTITVGMSSCSKKTGCPSTENAHVKLDKKGQFPTKKGKSNLFPKNMRSKKKN